MPQPPRTMSFDEARAALNAAPIPTVGRIVHYMSHGSPIQPDGTQRYKPLCRAAIITQVAPAPDGDPWALGLAVLNPGGLFFDSVVPQDETNHAGGTWHWPERA